MESKEFYNLPDVEASSQWALMQTDYDKAYVQGMVGPSEASAARAAHAPSMQPQPTEMELLMGTVQRSTFAEIEPMPGWTEIRWRDTIEAPSLGSVQKREADLRILDTLDDPRVEMVKRAIRQTMADNREIRYTRGLMGSILGG